VWDPPLCEREEIFAPDALNTASKFRCVRTILEIKRERFGIRVGVCV